MSDLIGVEKFTDELASSSPTPGGGSVAALCGGLSAALVSMVANLTLNKTAYKEVESQIQTILDRSEKIRAVFIDLIQEDMQIYSSVSQAYQMPKSTDSEKQQRSKHIQEALKKAALVPLRMVEQTQPLFKLCQDIAEIGNKNVISDAGVAAAVALAALESSRLNVLVNLAAITDQEFVRITRDKLESLYKNLPEQAESTINFVIEKIEYKSR